MIPALIAALKCRRVELRGFDDEDFDYDDCSTLEAAAKTLGSYRPRSVVAVPVMIELIKSHAKANIPTQLTMRSHWPSDRSAPARSRPFQSSAKSSPKRALDFLVGGDCALPSRPRTGRNWQRSGFEKPSRSRLSGERNDDLESRAMLLGAMGKTSLEADAVIRKDLGSWTTT